MFFMASCTLTTLTKLDRGGEENDVQIVVAGGNISLDLDQLLSSCNQGLWDSLFSLSDLQCIGVIALADHGILTVGDECHSCWLNSYKLHGQLAEQPPPSTRSHLQKIFFNKSIFYYCRQRIRLNFFLYSLGFPLSKRTSGILSVIFSFLF